MRYKRHIQLVRERQPGQRHPHPLAFHQTDAEVLHKVMHKEPRLKIPLQYPPPIQIQGPRPSRAGRYRLQIQTHIQPSLVGVYHPLHEPHHRRRDRDLVRQLRALPQTRPAHVVHLPHALEERRQPPDDPLVAAGEDGQLSLPGAAVSSGDGGVDGGAATGGGGCGDLDGEGGVAGGHVNDGGGGWEGGEDAGGGEDDGADVGGVADDGEDDVGGGGEGLGGGGELGPHLEEGVGLGGGAVEDGDGVAGGDEVGAHGAAHDACADPADAGGGR